MPTDVGTLHVLDRTGDLKIIWDRTKPDEVEFARKTWDEMKAKGYMGYSVTGEKATKGEVLQKFDAQAERLIMAPQMRGG